MSACLQSEFKDPYTFQILDSFLQHLYTDILTLSRSNTIFLPPLTLCALIKL